MSPDTSQSSWFAAFAHERGMSNISIGFLGQIGKGIAAETQTQRSTGSTEAILQITDFAVRLGPIANVLRSDIGRISSLRDRGGISPNTAANLNRMASTHLANLSSSISEWQAIVADQDMLAILPSALWMIGDRSNVISQIRPSTRHHEFSRAIEAVPCVMQRLLYIEECAAALYRQGLSSPKASKRINHEASFIKNELGFPSLGLNILQIVNAHELGKIGASLWSNYSEINRGAPTGVSLTNNLTLKDNFIALKDLNSGQARRQTQYLERVTRPLEDFIEGFWTISNLGTPKEHELITSSFGAVNVMGIQVNGKLIPVRSLDKKVHLVPGHPEVLTDENGSVVLGKDGLPLLLPGTKLSDNYGNMVGYISSTSGLSGVRTSSLFK